MLKSIAAWVGAIVVPLVILHVWSQTLPRLFPYQPAPGQTRFTLAQLQRLYQPVANRAVLYWIFGWILPAAIWYLALLAVAPLVYPSAEHGRPVVTPDDSIWIAVATVAGFTTAYFVVPLITRWRLGRRYGEYRLYRKWKYGRLGPPLLSAAMVFLALAPAFVIYIQLATYTLFEAERIVIKDWARATRSYSYREIIDIRGASETRRKKDGESYELRWYEIEFYDGFVWHVAHANGRADPCGNYPIFALAAEKSRQAITGLDHLAELDCRAEASDGTSDK